MIRKILVSVLLISLLLPLGIHADQKDIHDKSFTRSESILADVTDRASGIHNASNIGLYFENVGRISRDYGYGSAGEFPINSFHNYLFRLTPMVAIAPDHDSGRPVNVIQSLFVDFKEWEAVAGYHGPSAQIAFSDDMATWPESVWFFQNEDSEDHIVSSQDSYCVYNDANNSVEVLGIQMAQTGYAFGLAEFEDLIFFTFEITNTSVASYDSVYLGFYHDFDIGNDPGGADDYSDDRLGFDRANNFIWGYDADDYSTEWGQSPGMMGITFLETPMIYGVPAGITDMHHSRIANDDATLMTIFSSNLDYLPAGIDPNNYFFSGDSPDIHFDDLEGLDVTGQDIWGSIASGPFDLSPADTLKFVIALVAGHNLDDLYTNLEAAQTLHSKNFEFAKPPATPVLNGVAGDGSVTLFWSDEVEGLVDNASMLQDFEGYNLYRSVNRGLSWDQIDRNQVMDAGPNAVPLARYDRANGIGDDTGIAYSYRDETVINGIEYWYSLTAFDQGNSSIASLESPIGNSLAPKNVVGLTPRSNATNHISSASSGVTHTGTGRSNYLLKVDPVSPDLLSSYKYLLTFDYVHRQEIGDPGVRAYVEILDSSIVPTTQYGFDFLTSSVVDLYNLTSQEIIYPNMPFYWDYIWSYIWADGALYVNFENTDVSKSPSPGDYFSLIFAATLRRIAGSDTTIVMESQQFEPDIPLVSEDGLVMRFEPQPILQDISVPPILNYSLDFEVMDEDSLIESGYRISVSGIGTGPEDETFLITGVLREVDTVLFEADTVYSLESITFDGIEATLTFDHESPPPVGTTTTLTSVPPWSPHIQDAYSFGVIEEEFNPPDKENELQSIRVVPNPYMAGSLWEAEYGSYRREPIRQIQFTNLPSECEIRIFTLSGDLIKTLEHNTTHGTETWDMRAEGGREIVSGIYLYQVESAGIEYLNRFAVIK